MMLKPYKRINYNLHLLVAQNDLGVGGGLDQEKKKSTEKCFH